MLWKLFGLQRLLDELFDERGWLSLDLPRTTGWDHDDVPAIAQDLGLPLGHGLGDAGLRTGLGRGGVSGPAARALAAVARAAAHACPPLARPP